MRRKFITDWSFKLLEIKMYIELQNNKDPSRNQVFRYKDSRMNQKCGRLKIQI